MCTSCAQVVDAEQQKTRAGRGAENVGRRARSRTGQVRWRNAKPPALRGAARSLCPCPRAASEMRTRCAHAQKALEEYDQRHHSPRSRGR